MRTIILFGCVLSVLCAEGKVFHAKVGSSVTIECGVDTFSRSLKWEREGVLLRSSVIVYGVPSTGSGENDLSKRSTLKPNNKLEIKPVKTQDAGAFTCTADRTPNPHTLIVFSVSVQPSADLSVGGSAQLQYQVHGQNSGSVQWKGPDGREVQSPTVELNPVKRTDAGTWECIFTIDGKTLTESLAVRVTESAPSTATPLHPKIPKDDNRTICPTCGRTTPSLTKSWLELQWWVWVAVGVGGVVVILLIISVIVMYKRTQRRKKRFLRMKHANQMKPKQYCKCQHQRPTAAAKTQQGRRREKPSALPL